MAKTGTLYIVATPIGNLEDMTQRAQRILHQVDTIVAEDTRHTAHLLNHFQIKRPLMAFHAHNENDKADFILAMLQEGKDIALVSDAGTPLISDPGFPLVHAAQTAEIPVVPVPGPCALITALSVSGLPALPFHFAGFLPPKTAARITALESLKPLAATLIFYEAPHRLLDSVRDMETVFGNRTACLARELTKQFETVIRAPLTELIERIANDPNQQRGEAVLLVEGNAEVSNTTESHRILRILLNHLPLKQAVTLCAEISGVAKNALYEEALLLKKDLS